MVLSGDLVGGRVGSGVRLMEDGREIKALRLPVVHRLFGVEPVHAPDHLLHRAEAEHGHVFAHFIGDEAEEILHELGLPVEFLPKFRVLGGDADGAGVQMAHAHHNAAHDDERRGGKPEFIRTQKSAHDDVAPCLHLPVHLDGHPVAQPVEHEDLLGFRKPQFPGGARVEDARDGRRAGSAVVARDEDRIGMGLGDSRRHGADAHLGDELHVNARLRIRVFEVVYQLRQIFNRIDVVMRRRGYEPHPGRGVPGFGNPGIDLVAGELTPLSGLWPPGPS